MSNILTPNVRRWLYTIAIGALGVLAVKGIIDQELKAALDVMFAALFGLAIWHVPAAPDYQATILEDGDIKDD